MKRLPLVVAGFVGGTLTAALLTNTSLIASRFSDLLGVDSHAETAAAERGGTPDARHEAGHEEAGEQGHEHSEHESHNAKADQANDHSHGEGHEQEGGKIAMTADEIDGARIGVKTAESGFISKRLRVPGTIIPDRNRVGRVPSKVVGTVAELRKGLGDPVVAGEVIAILDSREVADAKSEYIAAIVNARLQNTLYEREKTLWEKQVSSEQRLLRAEATHEEAQVRRDVSRQKLSALGVGDAAIGKLAEAGQSASALERYEIKAPIGGRIVEQLVDLGTPMGNEGQAHELFAIADLSTIWVELTVSTQDLHHIKEGQSLTIAANGTDTRSDGTIVFTSPLLNQETRSARVIASVANGEGIWRPGSFVTADVAISESKVDLVVPKAALQTIKGETFVFVRTSDGFAAREVTVGADDGRSVEIKSGLKAGEITATENSFLLKAELGKAEAEHVH